MKAVTGPPTQRFVTDTPTGQLEIVLASAGLGLWDWDLQTNEST